MEYFIINTDASSSDGPRDLNVLNVWFEENLAFTGGPIEYGKQLSRLSPSDICLMYENRCGIVAIGRVLEKWNGKTYHKPIYYDVDNTEYRIKVHWFKDLRKTPITTRTLGYQPRRAVSRIVEHRAEIAIVIDKILSKQKFVLPEEIQDTETLTEGARETITVDKYERNVKARQRCIKHWGFKCKVCGMSFEQVYGPIGHEYIHVHHLKSLSEIAKEYVINPISDLRPVCPNCHAMLHNKDPKNPPYEINEIKEMLNQRTNKQM